MNVELLQKVRTRLLRMKHPEHFDMDTLIDKTDCGTTACILGHGLIISGAFTPAKLLKATDQIWVTQNRHVYPIGEEPWDVGKKVFGLTQKQATNLFYHYHWPSELMSAYEEARGTKEGLRVAAEAIQRFIDGKGTWLS